MTFHRNLTTPRKEEKARVRDGDDQAQDDR